MSPIPSHSPSPLAACSSHLSTKLGPVPFRMHAAVVTHVTALLSTRERESQGAGPPRPSGRSAGGAHGACMEQPLPQHQQTPCHYR